MTLKMRRLAMAGALLLAVTLTLLVRLNIDSLNSHVQQQIQGFSDIGLKAGDSSLSFMHGIGLRLDEVSLSQQHYQVHAGHMNIGIRLLPLLLGKVEIDTLDIHDSIIMVRPEAIQPTSTAISSLPFERIRLVRSEIRTFDGDDLLNNLHLELRNIGANRETLWDLQAQQQSNSISGHGRLNFYNGEISNGFGKLKLDRVPLKRLRAVTPKSVFAWFEQSQGNISGSLTLDITRNQTWAVFGELSLKEKSDAPALKLRGKLEHPEAGVLTWHDSFIHFSDSAVAAIDGQCRGQQCETGIDAANIDLKTWHPLLPESVSFHKQISGVSDLNAHVQWDHTGWDSSAAFSVKRASFMYQGVEHPLPNIELQSETLRGTRNSWEAKAILTSSNARGEMAIHSSLKGNGSKLMKIVGSDVDSGLWHPLANLLLSSLEITPTLEGSGVINGSVELQQQRKRKRLILKLDAKQAALSYTDLFKKPENIDASCNAEISWSTEASSPDQINLKQCQLDISTLTKANWQRNSDKSTLNLDAVSIHFDQLHNHGVKLPQPISEFRGLLEGSGSTRWKESEKDRWADKMSGEWRLQNFGKQQWHSNGTIKARQGHFESARLLIDGTFGKAELQGSLTFGANSGDVDILGADIDLSTFPAPPSSLADMNIRGRIHHAEVKLLQNQLQGIHGYYRIHRGKLTLENIQATSAGGELTAKKLLVTPGTGRYGISGKMRLKNILIEQVTGLPNLLQAELAGKLHANLELFGTIPDLTRESWQQSNGDILIYSGQWSHQSRADSLTEHLGIKKPELISDAFRELSFRFRILAQQTDLKSIYLHRNNIQLRGKALIDADQSLQGYIQSSDKTVTYQLGGQWPLISGTLEQ